jgi:hypothetical protein
MRLTFSALVLAAGLAGFGASAQAAPAPSAALTLAPDTAIVQVQMTRGERMMMRNRMERRMMRNRMERRMMRNRVERRMIRRNMDRRMMRRGY